MVLVVAAPHDSEANKTLSLRLSPPHVGQRYQATGHVPHHVIFTVCDKLNLKIGHVTAMSRAGLQRPSESVLDRLSKSIELYDVIFDSPR
ncbi:uncharacterized protein YALI1_F03205g [Yarrowia lipolytica]|uniref:Uncharacterized protein n=1 Tax=Yarrowia lipolytica TaxID=4952 RepID=A0A1D8NLK4_YARLL|nr:hypothetical protein YALI1_F03205g [Yarrowia lipolytica]